MKNIMITAFLLITSIVFSQDAITYKGNGKVLNSNNQKLTTEEVRNMLASNSQALNLYNAGKTKQTVGNILLYGGISTIAINHFLLLKKAKNDEKISPSRNIPYAIGAVMIITAIPIKIGFSRKIKKAVSMINEDMKNPKTALNIESSFISNSNGIGFSFTF